MTIKRSIIIFIIITFSVHLFASVPPVPAKIKCIVIDAGHGGNDPGAIGYFKTQEKDITLALALKLGALINEYFPDIKVVYTRKTDVFVKLFERADIANRNKADLFISIHCNAASRSTARGSETFVMGIHRSEANLAVAQKENASILLEDDYVERYDGFNPNSAEAYIVFSLFQNAYLNNSLGFASSIQQELTGRLKFTDRGVKQAGFLVLYRTAMPGVLVELGFISNPQDELFLRSKMGQESLAKGILNAFANYIHVIDGNKPQDFKPLFTDLATHQDFKAELDSIINGNKKHEGIIKTEELSNQFVAINTTRYESTCENDTNLVFKIQFATSSDNKPLNSKEFKKIPSPGKYFQDGLYKYTAGCELTMEDAKKIQNTLRELGYKDAFVIAFNNKVRISNAEAQKILNQ
ncbi:MAG: N-acetylmuramoyl-L-alanine amidase [Bacteroidales bacterium]|nr:N-acetylmuramoyl-L-alanine amidase [Bacteroidales bacterium]MDD4575790.1 N-acetylmuramoyl-L-alanine amidase [Bacteroidales bacterium]